MKEMERAYEDFASIVQGNGSRLFKEVALRDLLDSLGEDSVKLDNMVYERLGMSTEDVLEMLRTGDVLP